MLHSPDASIKSSVLILSPILRHSIEAIGDTDPQIRLGIALAIDAPSARVDPVRGRDPR